ncbi:MAG: hypothetical protein ABSB59_09975 [Streptosporangiaceae bacterium]
MHRIADQAQVLIAVLARTRAGFHRAVAGLAAAGNDVVADHVLSEPWRLLDCLAVMAGYRVVLDSGQVPTAFDRLRALLL